MLVWSYWTDIVGHTVGGLEGWNGLGWRSGCLNIWRGARGGGLFPFVRITIVLNTVAIFS
jgi:hypothetical protein